MDLEGENFNLTKVDWTSYHHRRAVAASLVRGAYNIERHHQQSGDPQVQSSHRWHFFHFELKCELKDDEDSSIYAVVYEIKHTRPNHLLECAPKYVIAFRGTILQSSTWRRDMELNMKLFTSKLHRDRSRFQHALEVVEEIVQEAGSANIWLAGHSLGSAIAMLVGKSLAQKGKNLETFLFNPPFLGSFASRIISNRYLEDAICLTKTVFNVGILFAGGGQRRHGQYDKVNALSSWIPNLFVNEHDPICSGYIGHFRNRNKMKKIGAGMIGSVAAQHSIRSASKAAIGKDPQPPIHLLPKAYLTISKNISSRNIRNVCEAHELNQWWYQMSIGPGFADSSINVSIGAAELVGEP